MSASIEPFRAMAISALAHQLKDELEARGAGLIHMEFGQPSTGAPKAAIALAHDILDRDPMGYWESAPLKARIARLYAEDHGVQIDPGRVVLTCGASPALVLALSAAFAPGDRVVTARPGYVAYRNTLKALHIEPVEIACGPAERYQMTARILAELEPAPHGVIIASPANPTGTVILPQEMEAIAKVCRARGIRIVSDEIYHGLSYVGPSVSMLCFDPGAIVVNSFSKYYSMVAWRLGWVVAPEDLRDAIVARMTNLFLTPPSLSQHVAVVAMDSRDELEGHIQVYRANRELLLAALPDLGLASIAPPDGAFYIWADISHLTRDSLAFCEKLLRETGVVTAPGVDFDPVDGGHFMRFSFAVSTAQVREALARMVPWFAAQARV